MEFLKFIGICLASHRICCIIAVLENIFITSTYYLIMEYFEVNN